MQLPYSQIHFLDTSIVQSTVDTTRYLNSLSGNDKRISDLIRLLISGSLVDTERQTSTYDAGNDMLSDLYEG